MKWKIKQEQEVKIKINEVFESIQGEGFQTGMKAIFIRFAGCNLNCSFCDTQHDKVNMELTAAELLETIAPYRCQEIIITGGEPTVQDEGLVEFCRLASIDYRISIETNGTNAMTLEFLRNNGWVEFITVSPKHPDRLSSQRSIDLASEVKFVYTDERIWESYDLPFEEGLVYIQPCSEDFSPAVEYVMQSEFPFRLSVQMQKVINVQ